MNEEYKANLVLSIIQKEDQNGCWNVLPEDDKHYKDWNYYVPSYSSTLWTLVFLADIGSAYQKSRFLNPLRIINEYFYDKRNNIFSIGESHYPIPCLNGNMIYLNYYFQNDNNDKINGIIDFFNKYQRFDDGEKGIETKHPFDKNKACYGKHSCYWGIVKLLKGLSFIPNKQRSKSAKELRDKCIDFILMHGGCYSSHNKVELINKNIGLLTFPNMYKADFLEILWILKRENIKSKKLSEAIKLLENKRNEGQWKIDRSMKNLIVPFGDRTYADEFVNERAKEVYEYYRKN